jgi:hypothetical protein
MVAKQFTRGQAHMDRKYEVEPAKQPKQIAGHSRKR